MKALGFIRRDVKLYVPLEKVIGIYQDETIFMYPELSDKLFGLVFINGEVVPVLDLVELLYRDNKYKKICEYSKRASLLLLESSNGLISFVYDFIIDIFEQNELLNVSPISNKPINLGEKNAFFVENTEIVEDIIAGIKTNIANLKEILLCPKES
ncbi:MAG: chemotaxis protein CheW [Deltaproteobacteria bacterium]|nr:chemotaxis protein CheW [Deltaproteobacteria bacterium]